MSTAKSDAATTKPVSIAAVVVTYNRLALLQECVAAIRSQTRRPDEIIVVNNSSTDGTADWLAAQPDLTVITQPNSGSAGGQYTGIKTAYHKGHDWFWCMDDDTIPGSNALECLIGSDCFSSATTGSIASLVVDEQGKLFGDAWLVPSYPSSWAATVLSTRCIKVPYSTFVSILCRREAVSLVGLPVRAFFVTVDDWEFTSRIASRFVNYCVLDSVVIHKSTRRSSRGGQSHLYAIRNFVAWTRAQRLGLPRTCISLLRQFKNVVRDVTQGHAPIEAFAWFFRGLTMAVRIEYP